MYETEEQQIAAIKEFWKDNKVLFYVFAVVFITILFGNHAWQNYQTKRSEKASNLYQEMLVAMQKVDLPKAKEKGNVLLKDYQSTSYSSLASMILAKVAIDEKDFSSAIKQYRGIIANDKKSPLKHVAILKIARLLHATGEHQAALNELTNPANGYVSMFEELKGDIYITLNDKKKAKEAYKNAISNSMGNTIPWVEMKLNNINTTDDAVEKGEVNENLSTTHG